MKIYFKSITLIVTLSSIAIFCYADDLTKNQEIAQRFAKCDTNHDGKLTKAEAKGCMPRIYDHFSYIDSGSKGFLTVTEIQAVADR